MPMPTIDSFDYSVCARTFSGETESGDHFTVVPRTHGLLIAVVDGLGHGFDAALAAKVAISTIAAHAELPLPALIKRCHKALTTTRGAAMAIAAIDRRFGTMAWLSIGNVVGVLLRTIPGQKIDHQHVLMRGGIVGNRLPQLFDSEVSLQCGDLLLFATDGVDERFHHDVSFDVSPEVTASRIVAHHGKTTDDALALVGRWSGSSAKEMSNGGSITIPVEKRTGNQ